MYWLSSVVCRILVPRWEIEPSPLAVEAWSPNHWIAREIPRIFYIMIECWKRTPMHTCCLLLFYFLSIFSLFEGAGSQWADGAWSAVNTAERLKKKQDMQILLYKDVLVTGWHSYCLLPPLTVTLPDPQDRERAAQTGIKGDCYTWTDRAWLLWVSGKDTEEFPEASTAAQLCMQRTRPEANRARRTQQL